VYTCRQSVDRLFLRCEATKTPEGTGNDIHFETQSVLPVSGVGNSGLGVGRSLPRNFSRSQAVRWSCYPCLAARYFLTSKTMILVPGLPQILSHNASAYWSDSADLPLKRSKPASPVDRRCIHGQWLRGYRTRRRKDSRRLEISTTGSGQGRPTVHLAIHKPLKNNLIIGDPYQANGIFAGQRPTASQDVLLAVVTTTCAG
jgi:hypothetical protein